MASYMACQRAYPVCVLTILLGLCPTAWPAKYGGTGTANDPYLICTPEQMNAIGADPNDWDKHFKLMADIDLSAYKGTEFSRIGCYRYYPRDDTEKPFTGVFDGADHTISNFSYTSLEVNAAGLFGFVEGRNAQIKNLTMIDPNLHAGEGREVGALVGFIKNATLLDCSVEGGHVEGYADVGGLVGNSHGAYVVRCYSTATVGGRYSVGGLVGNNGTHHLLGSMIQCFSTGPVVCHDRDVGGLVGHNWGVVLDCYSTGAVSGGDYAGGLAGRLEAGHIINCYSTGLVTGDRCVGGLIGDAPNWADTGNFWDIQTSGQTTSPIGKGLTTAQMQNAQTYLDAGWDVVGETGNGASETWSMPEERGYPTLAVFSGYTPPQLQGHGTTEEPYLISDPWELGAIVHYNPFAYYRLARSLDLSGISWTTALIPRFAGVFDGHGHTISHLVIKGERYLGLFGDLVPGAEIKDLGLVDVNIAGPGDCVGGLAVAGEKARVVRCSSTGVVRGHNYVGGLMGHMDLGYVAWCHTAVVLEACDKAGGLVGVSLAGTVTCSSSAGTVSGQDYVGGLLGRNENCGDVNECCTKNGVTGRDWVGGLVGYNSGRVADCYSTGSVAGSQGVGGLVGLSGDPLTHSYSTGVVRGRVAVGGLVGSPTELAPECFWDTQTSGREQSGGDMGKTTAEMKVAKTFLDAGWDFVGETVNGTEDLWWIEEGKDYPRLWWEAAEGPPL